MYPTAFGRRLGRAALALAVSVTACDGTLTDPPAERLAAESAGAERRAAPVDPSVLALLGERIFNDRDLSLKRNQSCASCHDVAWGFSSPNSAVNAAGAVMFGSVASRFGTRRPPSAAYATQSPVLYYDEVDDTYVGGNFWDGRATGARLGSPSAEQALLPFVNPVEQALPDAACVLYRIASGGYGALFTAAYGRDLSMVKWPANASALCALEGTTLPLSVADRALVQEEYDHVGLAIAAFEASPRVNQFSSKYDAYLKRQAVFTPEEKLGLALYEGKAQCSACHPSNGANALFTDYTYDNIGVPANAANPGLLANPLFADIGLGGFLLDPSRHGAQKVPTLRNIDKRGTPGGAKAYMHNGAFKSLEEVVHFYNTRDVLPDCTTLSAPKSGVNCWPAPEVTSNVNVDELGNLGLSPTEERAIVAYLRTLSDGFSAARVARD
jgi:cytochrome c peroxidase